MSAGWTSPAESSANRASDDFERQLSLVDRVLGLEAQLAELSIVFDLIPSEKLRAEQQINRMRSSLGWRIGKVIAAPAVMARQRLRRDR